jgi:hypothetical protein
MSTLHYIALFKPGSPTKKKALRPGVGRSALKTRNLKK